MAMETLSSPSHPMHELEWKEYHKPYHCDGCKEAGFGPRYRCEKCNFDLHKACMLTHNAPNSHGFFPGSTFEFLTNPTEGCCEECRTKCDACTRTIHGFVFHCDKPDLDLHPCCLNLKKSYRIEDVEFNLHKKMKRECMWCKSESHKDGGKGGWSYISECGKYHVHVACVAKMALEAWVENGGNTFEHEQSLDLKMNLKEIQAGGCGHEGKGKKFRRILKIFIQMIVSIVLGDPTMILASFFVQMLA